MGPEAEGAAARNRAARGAASPARPAPARPGAPRDVLDSSIRDLISCIPLDMVLNSMHLEATDKISDNTGLIKALKLLRLFRLSKIMKTMERRTQGGVQFTKLLFGVLLSCLLYTSPSPRDRG